MTAPRAITEIKEVSVQTSDGSVLNYVACHIYVRCDGHLEVWASAGQFYQGARSAMVACFAPGQWRAADATRKLRP